ncbi:MAG TPA: hypothetical protein VHZ55_23990 [Bryobacteraceae bacterium]|nr:hypothetical protein [Bryobacteraceae bacterium]
MYTKSRTERALYSLLFVGATSLVLWAAARAVIPAGTDVLVRVDEAINSKTADEGRVYAAHLDQDLLDSNANVAVRKGAPAEVLVRQVVSGKDLVLDLQALSVDGRRYFVTADDYDQTRKHKGIGLNQRTGVMVGGGTIFGSIIGALAGGGQGAAIGALGGAAGGGLTQIFTRGKAVKVPAEAVLTFRLERPLRLYEVEPR